MTDIVPGEDIERIVGVARHPFWHRARAVSAQQRVYILHSQQCVDNYDDLRECIFSLALDNGIDAVQWTQDVAMQVQVDFLDDTWLLSPVYVVT